MKSGLSLVYYFFVLWIQNTKNSNGVLFKLFLGSLNTKIFLSDIVFFMLIKAFEESSLQR